MLIYKNEFAAVKSVTQFLFQLFEKINGRECLIKTNFIIVYFKLFDFKLICGDVFKRVFLLP
jgi:hypothetical protein